MSKISLSGCFCFQILASVFQNPRISGTFFLIFWNCLFQNEILLLSMPMWPESWEFLCLQAFSYKIFVFLSFHLPATIWDKVDFAMLSVVWLATGNTFQSNLVLEWLVVYLFPMETMTDKLIMKTIISCSPGDVQTCSFICPEKGRRCDDTWQDFRSMIL